MDTRSVYRTVGFAAVVLCAACSLHDLLAGPTPQAQIICWSAAAASGSILLLRPGPRVVRVAGAGMTVAGVVVFCVHSLHGPATMLLAVGVLHTVVGDLLHRLASAIDSFHGRSAHALEIVSRMEHADPADYHERPSRLRVLEAFCTHPHYTSKDIGLLLHMSNRTVDNYLQRWIAVTGVDNRRQLATLIAYHFLGRNTDEEMERGAGRSEIGR